MFKLTYCKLYLCVIIQQAVKTMGNMIIRQNKQYVNDFNTAVELCTDGDSTPQTILFLVTTQASSRVPPGGDTPKTQEDESVFLLIVKMLPFFCISTPDKISEIVDIL